jgi:hypothetical protein
MIDQEWRCLGVSVELVNPLVSVQTLEALLLPRLRYDEPKVTRRWCGWCGHDSSCNVQVTVLGGELLHPVIHVSHHTNSATPR